jgi:hypothetical protein
MRDFGSAHPLRPCEQLGHIHVTPPDAERIRPGLSIPWCSIACPRCVPAWQIDQAPRDQSRNPVRVSPARPAEPSSPRSGTVATASRSRRATSEAVTHLENVTPFTRDAREMFCVHIGAAPRVWEGN